MHAEQADAPLELTEEERHDMIAVAAYYLAEARGFPGEGAVDDWISAERQIDSMVARMRQNGATRRSLDRLGLRNALMMWGQE
jgi:hypothetical protein